MVAGNLFGLVVGSWYFPLALTLGFYAVTRLMVLEWLGGAGFWWQIGWLGVCWWMALYLWMILGMAMCGGCPAPLARRTDGDGSEP